ncbi:uncharacterized protein ACJ7VT_019802 [Polymixia lowei]
MTTGYVATPGPITLNVQTPQPTTPIYIFKDLEDVIIPVTTDDVFFKAVIGGVTAMVLLIIFICMVMLGISYISRRKGSYLTNETDHEDSIGSDTALQTDTALEIIEQE